MEFLDKNGLMGGSSTSDSTSTTKLWFIWRDNHIVRVWTDMVPATLSVTVTQPCIFSSGCDGLPNQDPGPVSSEPSSGAGDGVIIVDNTNPNTTPPPCGAEDAVCKSITDGLSSAARLPGLPTVLVKPGMYNAEPAYPIQIDTPVTLRAENALETIIAATDRALEITAANVLIEGFRIEPGYWNAAVHVTGNVTIRNSEIRSTQSSAVVVHVGGSAIMEHCWLHGEVVSEGNSIMVKDTTITGYNSNINEYESAVAIYAGQNVLKNSTLYGSFNQFSSHEQKASHTELTKDAIHGRVYISEGSIASFTMNTIFGDDDNGQGVWIADSSKIHLAENLIVGNTFALRLAETSTAFISRNRFDAKARGITIIECEEATTLTSDGTNTLLNPQCSIACEGIPIFPGFEQF